MRAKNNVEKVFTSTHYPVDDWLLKSFSSVLDDPTYEDFGYWFAVAIGKVNCVSPDEYIALKHLEKCEEITEEQLNNDLSNYVSDPDVYLWGGNESNVLNLHNWTQQRLNQLYCLQDEFKKVRKKIDNEIQSTKIQLKEKEKRNNAENSEVLRLRDEVKHYLGDAQDNWTKLCYNIINIFTSGKETFVCQQQTEAYLHLNSLFELHWTSVKHLFNRMSQNKNLLELSSMSSSHSLNDNNKSSRLSEIGIPSPNYLNKYLQWAAFDCQEAEMECVITSSEITGISAALEYLNDLCQMISEKEVKPSFNDLSMVIPVFKEPKICTREELQIKCQHSVERMIIRKGKETKSKKMKWKQKKLLYLEELETILKKRKLLNNLFWRLHRREAKLVTACVALVVESKDILSRAASELHQKRVKESKETLEKSHTVQRNPVIKTLGLMLSNMTDFKFCNNYEDIDAKLKEIDNRVDSTQELIMVNLSKQIETVRNVFYWLKRFEQFVSTACMPHSMDAELIKTVRSLKGQQERMKNDILSLKLNFREHKMFLEDPYRRLIKYMWIDLLRQPDKLISDVHQIQKEARTLEEEVIITMR